MVFGSRRVTQLTNAFSKKAETHVHMMAIYFMHYNFVRIHQTLKITPAMAANVTDKLWEMSDGVKVQRIGRPPTEAAYSVNEYQFKGFVHEIDAEKKSRDREPS
jgi:hypothetical protein